MGEEASEDAGLNEHLVCGERQVTPSPPATVLSMTLATPFSPPTQQAAIRINKDRMKPMKPSVVEDEIFFFFEEKVPGCFWFLVLLQTIRVKNFQVLKDLDSGPL